MKDTDGAHFIGFDAFAKTTVTQGGKLTAPTTPVSESLWLTYVDIANKSGSSAQMGFGYQHLDANWLAGQWDDSEDPAFTDDTTDAQDAGATDFPLFTTTNNDGFVVQSTRTFGLVYIAIGATAEAGSPVYEYSYWDGSAWTTFTPISTPDYTDDSSDQHLLFSVPDDWTALAAGDTPVDTEGLTAGYYAIRARATTAPDTAPVASRLKVVSLLDFVGAVPDGNNLVRSVENNDKTEAMRIPPGHSFVPYSNQASDLDAVTVQFFKCP